MQYLSNLVSFLIYRDLTHSVGTAPLGGGEFGHLTHSLDSMEARCILASRGALLSPHL